MNREIRNSKTPNGKKEASRKACLNKANSKISAKSFKCVSTFALFALISVYILSTSLTVSPAFGAVSITLKWSSSAGTGGTAVGPLAADLNNDGLMEIVITGSSGIAALDPRNGKVLWKASYGGYHCPPEILDLNKDGIPEILLAPSNVQGLVALYGNTGKVYWHNPDAAGGGRFIAAADINGDGFPEIYSATAGKVTALTYDGRIFASTYTYYPCWGGMTIGDTNFDGVFEVYLGERSNSYPNPDSPGRGLRAFWAENLTEIWCHPDITCSSHTPVLADVDRNGDLEIIALPQGGGIIVCNTDGSVNTYNGIYRKSKYLGLTCHCNPTVFDLDGDGNLELITNGDEDQNLFPPKIWDLVDWKLDATLPYPSKDPPGIADVDGDGKIEILNCNPKNITIFKYSTSTNKYNIIGTIKLANANPFSIAQDIDKDGKIELIFGVYGTSDVYVYDVEASAPNPLPRSGRYFYSEYRTRAPYYTPPPKSLSTQSYSVSKQWYGANWTYRKTITIDYTKVGGTLTNFPVLIDITDSSLTSKAQPDGDDFLFTDANNVKLAHQIELYDGTKGRLIAWVKIPTISSTQKTVLYLYYGNPSCGSQQNSKAVWDTSYKLVLHLKEKSGTHYDSTVNANNGLPFNGVSQGVSCKVDGGDSFDGVNDYVQVAHSNTLAGYTNALTVSFWVKIDNTGKRQTILGKYNTVGSQRSWFVDYNPVNRPKTPFGFYASYDGVNYREWWASFVPSAGVWYHVVIVWESNKVPKFYINGAQVTTVGTATISQIYNNVDVPLLIGRCQYDGSRYLQGSLDEIRISNTARTANWILTNYNNQKNPTTFYTLGAEETYK